MLILLNQPMLTLLLVILLLLFIKSNNNRYGITLSHKRYRRLLAKNSDVLDIVDIRDKERFDESHTVGSQHFSSVKISQNQDRKLVIVHDSDIQLANYFREHNLKQFSDNIYQTNMIDHNFNQYQLVDAGIFKGSELSALMKNNELA